MEEIEQEYESYVVSDDVKETIVDPFSLVLSIEIIVKKFEKVSVSIRKKKNRNKLYKMIFLGENYLIQEEDDCWNKVIKTIEDNTNHLTRIVEVIDEDNFIELAKLVDFMVAKYETNMEFFVARLNSINASYHGFHMVDYSKNYTHPQVMEFVERKINGLKKEKELEK